MGILSVAVTFLGYMLVYASVAGPPGHGGIFVSNPWVGVVTDAYDAQTTTPDASEPAPAQKDRPASSPLAPTVGRPNRPV